MGSGPLAFIAKVRGDLSEVGHLNDKAARGAGRLDLTKAQSGRLEITLDLLLQLWQGEAGEIRGQLLGPDLKQKGGHGAGGLGTRSAY